MLLEIIHLSRMDPNACKERLMNASTENGQNNVTKDERDHRQCRKIEIGRPIFNRNTIFRFRLKS
jgi:hypothetical protein